MNFNTNSHLVLHGAIGLMHNATNIADIAIVC